MSNHITVADFRANYDHYMERMEAGESFCITDMEENKDKLYDPLDDNRGIPIDIETIEFWCYNKSIAGLAIWWMQRTHNSPKACSIHATSIGVDTNPILSYNT